MSEHRIGIIMNGVTGRMGTNQHLIRSILAIREQGGVQCGERRIIPEPILTGRSEEKLRALAESHGVERYTTDLESVLKDDSCPVFFDASGTPYRIGFLERAIAAGKNIYCEKPTATSYDAALAIAEKAEAAGVKNGTVQDKLWLPGIQKFRALCESGFFGEILSKGPMWPEQAHSRAAAFHLQEGPSKGSGVAAAAPSVGCLSFVLSWSL